MNWEEKLSFGLVAIVVVLGGAWLVGDKLARGHAYGLCVLAHLPEDCSQVKP